MYYLLFPTEFTFIELEADFAENESHGGTIENKLKSNLFDVWKNFPFTDNLISMKENRVYDITDSFLNQKCYPFLENGHFGFYTFYALAEFVALCLLTVVTGIGLYMLHDDKTFGKVVVAIFLKYIPKLVDVVTKPWHNDVSTAVIENFIKDKIDEEIKRRQNILTLRYTILVLLLYYRNMQGTNEQ